MFYLETNDGDRFLTNADSDDKQEFEKILESKLGRLTAELFSDLIEEAASDSREILNSVTYRYKECIDRLDAALAEKPIDTEKLDDILSDFQAIYMEYFYGR